MQVLRVDDDVEIKYLVRGQSFSPTLPVLLLHGFPDSSSTWKHQISFLEEHGFRLVVPDMRGFGESSKPEGTQHYTFQKLAQDIIALLDALSIDRCYLVGHDWGAGLSWILASTNPERFKKLIVLSTGHPAGFMPYGGNEQRQRSWYMLFFSIPQAEQLLSANNWALWKHIIESEKPEIVEAIIEQVSKEGVCRAGLEYYKANVTPELFGRLQPPEIPKMDLETLGIWSSRDVFLTKAQMEKSAEFVVPGKFTFHELDNVGHWMQLEAPDKVNNLILDFLRKNSE